MSHRASANTNPPSALARGVRLALVFALLGAFLGVGTAYLTNNSAVGLAVGFRLSVLGAAVGLAHGVNIRLSPVPGKPSFAVQFGSTVGLLGGLILAGALTGHLATAEDGSGASLTLGQVMEIAGPTVDGGRFDLAEQRGKVVLVDFWATWCGPCLVELPSVRAIHSQYKDSGLVVVGVSLDHKRASLLRFLKEDSAPWPHIFFGEDQPTGFESPLAQRYSIDGIPCLLVVDGEGRLIARNLRGRALKSAIADALGQPLPFSERLARRVEHLFSWLFGGLNLAPWWLVAVCVAGMGMVPAFLGRLARSRHRESIERGA